VCRDDRRIKQTLNITRLSKHKFQMAALIYQGSTPISVGINQIKTHPRQVNVYTHQQGWSIHAELAAILNAHPESLEGATIYVARKLKNGQNGTARPCPACMQVIRAVGIRRIVYTHYTGYTEEDVI